MRVSEKTLELNLCTQFSEHVQGRTLWFGLTQRQEAQWGFDASSKLGGQLIIFQFKAPKKRISEGVWRFQLQYRQLLRLQELHQGHGGERLSIFYGFPLIFSAEAFQEHPELLPQTWLLDVQALPEIPPPQRKDRTSNMNGAHAVEVRIEEPPHPKAYIAIIKQHFLLRCAEDLVDEVRTVNGDRVRDFGKAASKAALNEGSGQMHLPLGGVGVLLW
jgi:hypothetical protein